MKKLCLFLAAVMLFSAVVIIPASAESYYDPIVIIAGDVSVAKGESEAVVPITIYNPNDLGLGGFVASFKVSGAVVDLYRCKLDGHLQISDPGEEFSFMWADNNVGIFAQEFIALELYVTIPSSVPAGKTLTVEVIVSDDPDNYLSFYEVDGDIVGYGAIGVNGSIKIEGGGCNPNAGDVNGDKSINAKDVTTLMKELVGKYVSYYDSFAADVNADNTINAKDVTKLMKYLVGDKTARLGHNDKLTTITPSTCTKRGVGTVTCTICGFSETVELPLKAHTKGSGKVTKAATCTAAGERTYYCTVCGQLVEREKIPAAGHKWDSGKVTTKATYIKTGVKTYTCTVCGKTKTETVPKLAPNWKKAYRDFAENYYIDFWPGSYLYMTYALIDLNSDGTPELYMKNNTGPSVPDVICTVEGDKVNANYVWSGLSTLYHKPGGNLFFLVGIYSDGLHKLDLCKVSNGITVIRHGYYGPAGGTTYPFTWDTTNGSQYGNDQFSIVTNNGMVKFDESLMMTYSEFIDYIS